MKTFSEKTLAQMLGELSSKTYAFYNIQCSMRQIFNLAMGTRSGKHDVKKVYGMLIEKFSGVYVFEMDIDRHDGLIGGSKFKPLLPFLSRLRSQLEGTDKEPWEACNNVSPAVSFVIV